MRRTSGASCDSLKASAAVGTGTVGGRGAEGEDAHKVHAEFAATAQHQMAKADRGGSGVLTAARPHATTAAVALFVTAVT